MKKLTVLDAKGEPTQVGFALRHKGHPVGIAPNPGDLRPQQRDRGRLLSHHAGVGGELQRPPFLPVRSLCRFCRFLTERK